MNPCSKCGAEPQLEVDSNNTAFMHCGNCGRTDLHNSWNSNNPIPEPDPLAIANDQLIELYCFLDEIKYMDLITIRLWANDLLAKHRSVSND